MRAHFYGASFRCCELPSEDPIHSEEAIAAVEAERSGSSQLSWIVRVKSILDLRIQIANGATRLNAWTNEMEEDELHGAIWVRSRPVFTSIEVCFEPGNQRSLLTAERDPAEFRTNQIVIAIPAGAKFVHLHSINPAKHSHCISIVTS